LAQTAALWLTHAMTRKLIFAMALTTLAGACSAVTQSSEHGGRTARTAADGSSPKSSQPKSKMASGEHDGLAADAAAAPKIGDYVVSRYSGSYRKRPLVVTEEVVAREGELWVTNHTFEDGDKIQSFRVRTHPLHGIVRVSKVENASEVDVTLDTYEALLAQTAFAADSNQETLGSEQATCLVGTVEHTCETTEYRVIVADKPATMRVTRSRTVKDRDLSGEISAGNKLIYRAEVVEMGNSAEDADSMALIQ
jgi:hypothetical protein